MLTQELTRWLMKAGGSPDLVHEGLRIARESLSLARARREPLEFEINRVAVEAFCLGETVAMPLFETLRETCTVRVTRGVLDRVPRDPVRHRHLGWTALCAKVTCTARASFDT